MIKNGFLKTDKTPVVAKSPGKAKRAPSVEPPVRKSRIFDFGSHSVRDLKLPQAVSVAADCTCAAAAKIMETNNFDQVPVIATSVKGGSMSPKKNAEHLIGLVTLGNIMSKVAHGHAALNDPVTSVMFRFDSRSTW